LPKENAFLEDGRQRKNSLKKFFKTSLWSNKRKLHEKAKENCLF
jgi:hypothetical protein